MTVIRQRADGDCAVAALAITLQETYEDIYVEVCVVDPINRGKCGLYNREIVDVAKRLGVDLHPTRAYDLDEDEGILKIRWNDPDKAKRLRGGHYVAVRDGLVACPGDGVAVPWREYLKRSNSRPCTLLRVSES